MSDWKKVTNIDSITQDFEINPVIEGILTNKKTNLGANNSTLYEIEIDGGDIVGVWGSTVLDNKMSKVVIGKQVKIEYLGQELNPKTKRTYKNFDVFVKDIADEVAEDLSDLDLNIDF